MKKKEKINYTVPILFLLYLALLIWIILFKLQFSILDLDRVREINLIPFYYEHEVTFHATEVLQNVLIFMPFGIYLCLLLPKSRFGVKLLLTSVVSLLLEICQYVLAIGRGSPPAPCPALCKASRQRYPPVLHFSSSTHPPVPSICFFLLFCPAVYCGS